jgi:hypothetical protein
MYGISQLVVYLFAPSSELRWVQQLIRVHVFKVIHPYFCTPTGDASRDRFGSLYGTAVNCPAIASFSCLFLCVYIFHYCYCTNSANYVGLCLCWELYRQCYFLDKLPFFKMSFYKGGTKSSCNLIKDQSHKATMKIKVACTSLYTVSFQRELM